MKAFRYFMLGGGILFSSLAATGHATAADQLMVHRLL